MRVASLGQVQYPLPRTQTTDARFEVKDADGNYVSGVTISVYSKDGKFILSKNSDSAGNVAFGTQELLDAFNKSNTAWMPGGGMTYTATYNDATIAQGTIYDPDTTPDYRRIIAVTVPSSSLRATQNVDSKSYLLLGGVLVLVGGAIYFFNR